MHIRLGHDQPCRGKAGRDRRDHVLFRGGIVSRDEPDAPREERQGPLPLEQPFCRQLLLQSLERREVIAEPEAFQRERAQAEVAARLEQLRAAEDVNSFAVDEVEAKRVEAGATYRHSEARSVVRVLQGEEDGLPASIPA